ncbi:unnamed protein product, partial [Urochloa humidicola]
SSSLVQDWPHSSYDAGGAGPDPGGGDVRVQTAAAAVPGRFVRPLAGGRASGLHADGRSPGRGLVMPRKGS